MYTVAGAELSGEADKKGTIATGKYTDLAILSADYFTVPDAVIPSIESELTITGGRIVYASDAFEGQDEELPEISLGWSPVAHCGSCHKLKPGVIQAQGVTEAAAESAEQTLWRQTRGEHVTVYAQAGMSDDCLAIQFSATKNLKVADLGFAAATGLIHGLIQDFARHRSVRLPRKILAVVTLLAGAAVGGLVSASSIPGALIIGLLLVAAAAVTVARGNQRAHVTASYNSDRSASALPFQVSGLAHRPLNR